MVINVPFCFGRNDNVRQRSRNSKNEKDHLNGEKTLKALGVGCHVYQMINL